MSAPILPKHIAIVMDGNGRWAKKRFLPRTMGHKAALNRVRELVQYCGAQGVEVLTLFAFSTENWKRPEAEVSFLMQLFFEALSLEMQALHRNQVQIKFMGDLSVLNSELQARIHDAEMMMAQNLGLKLRIAVNYGARTEILCAVNTVLSGSVHGDAVTEAEFSNLLYTAGLPDPDLFIRTSGECRVSNFLLWQLAYAEIYFVETLFPDFGTKELAEAIEWFGKRERRFGMISEQLDEHT